jgi:lambda family phage portal protein
MTRRDTSEDARKNRPGFARRASEMLDGAVEIFSPAAAVKRKACRFTYDAIDKSRTRKKRSGHIGTGDSHLTQARLGDLRELCRDQAQNNPMAKSILDITRNGVIGSGVKIQSRSTDKGFAANVEATWKEEMLDRPCDVTGLWNFNQYLSKLYLGYLRDGDIATIYTRDGIQAVEGEQIGRPAGQKDGKTFFTINGVVMDKETRRVIGYYIGKPDKWGILKQGSFKKFLAKDVHLMFDPDRFSQSRGEPLLTASAVYIDALDGYFDASIVAARIEACFTMFVSRKDEFGVPGNTTGNPDSVETQSDGSRQEKVDSGQIFYGRDGEEAKAIEKKTPGGNFEPFVNKFQAIIGRPAQLPLMLISGDFAGATFMNTRVALQKTQEHWEIEQDNVVKPFVSRTWTIWLATKIATGEISNAPADAFAHEVQCRRWPYVDPNKESKADKQDLDNGTTTQSKIAARRGNDPDDIVIERKKEVEVAIKASTDIESETGVKVPWQTFAGIEVPAAAPALPPAAEETDDGDGTGDNPDDGDDPNNDDDQNTGDQDNE